MSDFQIDAVYPYKQLLITGKTYDKYEARYFIRFKCGTCETYFSARDDIVTHDVVPGLRLMRVKCPTPNCIIVTKTMELGSTLNECCKCHIVDATGSKSMCTACTWKLVPSERFNKPQ